MVNFTTLAFNPMSRMNEVSRYSSVYQETNESLAEHITDVSVMSYLIAKTIQSNFTDDIDLGKLLEKCLLHDIDEVITGDVPRNTKYATDSVHDNLDQVASNAVDLIEKYVGIRGICEVWDFAKEGKEGAILKIVDMLCVVKKSITEIELRGNLSFLKVVTELETHLTTMLSCDEVYNRFEDERTRKFLKNLVSQAKDETVTIRVKYQSVIDKYHIKENVIRGC